MIDLSQLSIPSTDVVPEPTAEEWSMLQRWLDNLSDGDVFDSVLCGLARRCRELEAEVEKRICGTCMERHPFDVMCPPFEVRRTGSQWFRDRVKELEADKDCYTKEAKLADAHIKALVDEVERLTTWIHEMEKRNGW